MQKIGCKKKKGVGCPRDGTNLQNNNFNLLKKTNSQRWRALVEKGVKIT
jgi:hypothetical protein